MFRLTRYMQEVIAPTPVPPRCDPVRPVVVWNLTRRCNLHCRRCPTASADVAFPGELDHAQAMAVLEDLSDFGIPALVLSGGEPLARFDVFDLAERARVLGFRHLALSTNGTQVAGAIDRIAAVGFDLVGISLDGIAGTNDRFRGVDGAFAAALAGLRACKAAGLRVGLRFALTEENADFLPDVLALCRDEGVDRFQLSHLVYDGRGDLHGGEGTDRGCTRRAMDQLLDFAWASLGHGAGPEIVTGNNDADAVYFLAWVSRRFGAVKAAHLRAHLESWGGGSGGLAVAGIDPQGKVHPDGGWSGYSIGNVKREPFSALWTGPDPVMAALRARPQPLKGRCGACAFQSICGGNSRIRALQQTGDPWAEDPACYLSDDGIGLPESARPNVTPFRRKSPDPAQRVL